jgi:hypothetical protein
LSLASQVLKLQRLIYAEFRRQREARSMAATTEAEVFVRKAYDKSKDLVTTVKDQSSAVYDDARRWVPEHRTALAVSASAAISAGLVGYALGRRRRRAENMFAVIGRPFAVILSPFFKMLKR